MDHFYHGTPEKDWQISPHRKSRYGFWAIFGTSSLDLARAYSGRGGTFLDRREGFVYRIEYRPGKRLEIDLHGARSFNAQMRNLIYEIYRQGPDSAVIRNVADSPAAKTLVPVLSDIHIVFAKELIAQIVLC
jgi:hypothetical protein